MALILLDENGKIESTCCHCGKELAEPFYATTHFITDPHHPLSRFSDAPMHWSCYASWPDQPAFADLLFETKVQNAPDNELWIVILQGQNTLVTYGKAVGELDVLLRKSGSSIRVHRDNWKQWCESNWIRSVSHSLEKKAVQEVLPALREIILPPRDLQAESALSDLVQRLLKRND